MWQRTAAAMCGLLETSLALALFEQSFAHLVCPRPILIGQNRRWLSRSCCCNVACCQSGQCTTLHLLEVTHVASGCELVLLHPQSKEWYLSSCLELGRETNNKKREVGVSHTFCHQNLDKKKQTMLKVSFVTWQDLKKRENIVYHSYMTSQTDQDYLMASVVFLKAPFRSCVNECVS